MFGYEFSVEILVYGLNIEVFLLVGLNVCVMLVVIGLKGVEIIGYLNIFLGGFG